jgi:predicted PurR-regulated permease PerM
VKRGKDAGQAARVVASAAPSSELAQVSRHSASEIALIMIAVVTVVAAISIAQPFLVPVVAGTLLSYTLRPLVTALERIHVPRVAGAAVVILVMLALMSAAVYAIRDDLNDAVARMPVAARKVRQAAVEAARGPPGPVSNIKAVAAELDRAASEATGKSPAVPTASSGVTGQIQDWIAHQSAQALTVMAQILISVLLSYFLLVAGDTFRRKMTKLAGESLARRRVTLEVLNDIDGQIQRYMATMLVSNVLIALATWGGLALVGVPNAGMWGAVTGVLHVIPYAGTAIAAGLVGVAAFVQAGAWGDAMLAMAVVVAIAEAIGVGFTTWLQGRAARMNPVAVFIGVLFFGWIWGGWGLLLGVPILAILKSIADRVDAMAPVSELLGR